ncbi:MAG TPA: ABC transporter permease [Anaerolineales bacterium]|nr:ABC transporter permease [Anaerolineales bacterium]
MTASKTLTPRANAPTVLIKPQRGLVGLDLRELLRFRELIVFLTWRDILVRYKQTLLGGTWALVQPIMQMLIFNVLFGDIAGLSSGGIPRPLFTFAALLPWNLFSNAMSEAGRSLVTNRNMITKVYFPRIVVPLSSVLSGVVDFAVAFLVLAGMMLYYGVLPTSGIWGLPFYLLLSLVTALGVGLWLGALNVHYRDVRHIIPFLTQFWMLATPIAYEANEIFRRLPEGLQWLYALNPMVGVIEGFRNALVGTPIFSTDLLWVSLVTSLVLLVSGLIYFRRMERTFADVV